MKFKGIIILVIGGAFFVAWQAFSYDNLIVHPMIADAAAKNYNNQTSDKLSKEKSDLIIQGSIEEDVIPRYLNHFYDPSTGMGLLFPDAVSAKSWAQKQDSISGDYSETAILNNYKNGNVMTAYKGIGHILHLIQDMAVPAHTRNDQHAEGDLYEKWAQQNGAVISDGKIVSIPNIDFVFDDLATFTHNNFYSKDSIDNTIENKINNIKIETDDNGESALYGYYNDSRIVRIKKYNNSKSYVLDSKVFKDYWNQLSPKATSYSAGVIDYFVRKFAEMDKEKQTAKETNIFSSIKNSITSALDPYKYALGAVVALADFSSQEKNNANNNKQSVVSSSQYQQQVSQQLLDLLAKSLPKSAKSAAKTISNVVNNIAPQTSGQVLGIKVVQAEELPVGATQENIVTDTPTQPDINSNPNTQAPSHGPIFILPGSDVLFAGVDPIVAIPEPAIIPTTTPVDATTTATTTEPTPADTVAPTVSISGYPPSLSSSTSALFNFNASEDNVSYYCSLDGGTEQPCQANAVVDSLSDGAHLFAVFAVDPAGNVGSSTSISWSVDSSAPTSSLLSLNNKYDQTGFTVSWQGTDIGTTSSGLAGFDVQYKISTGDWQDWINNTSATSSMFLQPVDNKTAVSFRVRAVDVAGNVGAWSSEVGTVIDNNQADHVVISEIQTGGATADDEFIELYNPTNNDINLSGWKLGKRTANATTSYDNLLTSFPNKIISAHGYFLIAHPSGYDGNVPADAVYSSASYYLADNNSVILYSDAGQTIVDMVGMGSATSSETSAAPNPSANSSIERKASASSTAASLAPGGSDAKTGNGYDSGNNADDFVIRSSSDPQNSYSAKEPSEWTVKASMLTARSSHAGAFNPADGRIYVVGGENNGTALSSVESYDAAANAWTAETSAQNARWGLTSGIINDNLIVTGGSPTPSGSVKVEAYDCSADQWINLSDMPNPGWGVASGVINNKLYVLGGYNWSSQGMNWNREYDPIGNSWQLKAPMPTKRSWLGAAVVDNKIYALGGWNWNDTADLATLEVYDPSTDAWTAKASMPAGMRQFGLASYGGKLYVFGGYSGENATAKYYSTVYSYDPATDSWARLNDLDDKVSGAVAVSVGNGIYLVGGKYGSTSSGNNLFWNK